MKQGSKMAPVIQLQLSFVKSKGYFFVVAWQCIPYFGHSWCLSVFGFLHHSKLNLTTYGHKKELPQE